MSEEQLDNRLLREFNELKNQAISNVIKGLLPSLLVPIFINKVKIDANKKVNEITKQERQNIIKTLKRFELIYDKLDSIDHAIVTSGGVSTSELNPKTFESKIVSGLYFVGEVVDIDCLTGGFNIQCALSMGYAAGNNI